MYVPRTSLFWPLSPRTCDGSPRWSPGRHPLAPCVLRSVGVAWRALGPADQSRLLLTKWPTARQQQPTFCNNICAKRTLAKAVMSEKCPTAGVRGSCDQFVRLPWSQCGVKQTRCDVHGRALPQAAKAALIWPPRTREGGRVPDNSIITPPPLMPISM